MKRVFLIVLDSVGIGALPDACAYGDEGSNTVRSAASSPYFYLPNLEQAGFFQLPGLEGITASGFNASKTSEEPIKKISKAVRGRLAEASCGKDTTTGHWEIAGIVSPKPLPVFPDGFPEELIAEFERRTGRGILCNRPYSGTEVIREYGEEHKKTGKLIVYTSADSVFQIAAHEAVVPVEELYRYCEIARELCTGIYGVGRVIARPFDGEYPFHRTSLRHDYSIVPPSDTMLDKLQQNGFSVLAVGKINDIFAGQGITKAVRTTDNAEGMERTLEFLKEEFEGLCFTNLVDFDMLYGHRNDIDGYAKALSYFDVRLPELLEKLQPEDLLIVTADHGCDPATPSTDHSREFIPVLLWGSCLREGIELETRTSFADIGKTILDYFGVENTICGQSFLKQIVK